MLQDIEIFQKCKLSVAAITKILNCKYPQKGLTARYQDVYGIVKQLIPPSDKKQKIIED